MNLQETLRAFANKTKTADDVMRAVMNHDAFQVPVLYAGEVLKTEMFDRLAIWGTGTPNITPGEMWFFTDDAAANVAVNKGWIAGPYATAMRGWKMFENLPDSLLRLQINPASPPGEGWVIHRAGFELARLWAKAVELEALLRQPNQGLIEAMVGFPAFTLFVLPNGTVATAVGAGGMKNPAMIFTTPDCVETILREAGPQTAATLKRVYVSGKDLFTKFPHLGIDGLIVNPRGPGVAQALDLQFCNGVIEWIALDAKAKELKA